MDMLTVTQVESKINDIIDTLKAKGYTNAGGEFAVNDYRPVLRFTYKEGGIGSGNYEYRSISVDDHAVIADHGDWDVGVLGEPDFADYLKVAEKRVFALPTQAEVKKARALAALKEIGGEFAHDDDPVMRAFGEKLIAEAKRAAENALPWT